MPREVLTLQVGQCGNQIGRCLWEVLLEEHAQSTVKALASSPLGMVATAESVSNGYTTFDEGMSSVFRPIRSRKMTADIQQLKARALLVDMEEGVVHRLLRCPIGSLFDDALLITDVSGAGNNWAHGHEVYGKLHGPLIADTISRALEECDSPQAFLFLHSLGGGTGSGLGTKCLEMMADFHPQIARFVCAVSPGDTDDVVTSPYNTALALHMLQQHATCVVPVCNDALSKVRALRNKDESEPFTLANGVVAQMLGHLTSSVRFSGPLDVDLRDLSSNLVPYKGLHFLSSALSPLEGSICDQQKDRRRSPEQILKASHLGVPTNRPSSSYAALLLDVLSPSFQLLDMHPKRGTCLAAAFMFRGRFSMGEIVQQVDKAKRHLRFPSFCRGSTKLGICSVPPSGQATSLLTLLNSCEIRHHFSRVLVRFQKLYARRAHLHHYTQFMERELLDSANESLESLVADYSHLDTHILPPRICKAKNEEQQKLSLAPSDSTLSKARPLI